MRYLGQPLENNPCIAVCFVESGAVQIIVKAEAVLHTIGSNKNFTEHYWSMLPLELQQIYGVVPDINTLKPPMVFGVLECYVKQWELLLLNDDYKKSERYVFQRSDSQVNHWSSSALPVLS